MQINSRNQIGSLLELGLLNMPACEVGVAEGRYSREILDWGVPLLYLVDLWRHVDGAVAELGGWSNERHEGVYRDCLERLVGCEERYRILRNWSHEAAKEIPDGSLGFCYIDATHTFGEVTLDLQTYWPKLVAGGIMAGHDYTSQVWPDVGPAVRAFARDQGVRVHLIPENHDNDASFWMRKPC